MLLGPGWRELEQSRQSRAPVELRLQLLVADGQAQKVFWPAPGRHWSRLDGREPGGGGGVPPPVGFITRRSRKEAIKDLGPAPVRRASDRLSRVLHAGVVARRTHCRPRAAP